MGEDAARPLVERLRGRRVGVVLSSGYFGFFGHAGFLQALDDAGVAPACWAGSSAGALVAAMAAAGMKGSEVARRLGGIRREDFWDPDPLGVLAAGLRGHGATGLLAGRKFRGLLERELPARFEDLRSPCVVVAANLTRNTAQAFDRGELPGPVHASCAYPGMFRAAQLGGELFWDGGLLDKAPALALHRAQRPEVLLVHYLPSRSAAGGAPAGWSAWPRAMAASMAALREDHFRLQIAQLRQAGAEVVVLTSELPALGPKRLAEGPQVAQLARRKVAETLANSFTGPLRGG